jgi:signal transduction histidine kinase
MRDLSWIRKQGRIIEEEKRRIRRETHVPIREKLESFTELFEIFEERLKETEIFFQEKRHSAKIELQNRIKSLNSVHH